MRIIGTYGIAADNPDETAPLNAIPATDGDTYICISTIPRAAYVNAAGTAVSNTPLDPGDYIICVNSAVVDDHDTVTTPARWTIVANTTTNTVTTNDTLTEGTVVLGNGNKTVKKLAAGIDGQFLRQTGNRASWQDHLNPDHGIGHAVCDSRAEDNGVMDVLIPNYTLQPYAILSVMFANGVNGGSTLRVDGYRAIPIFHQNVLIHTGAINPGDTATFMYDPSFIIKGIETEAWVLISVDRVHDIPANLSAFTNDIQALLVCTTAAGIVAKTVTDAAVTIKAGSVFAVRFSNAVGANSTLTINDGVAKPIKHRNANITAYQIRGGDTATFIYDGTAYHLLSVDRGYDTAPTSGSHNLVDSDAIYQAILSAVDDATLYWEEMQ